MSNLQKHSIYLRAGDMEFLIQRLPEGKASEMVRKVVSRFVDDMRAAEGPAPEFTDLNLD